MDVTRIEEALEAHMELEETVLYPKMAPVTGSDIEGASSMNKDELVRALVDA